MDAISASEIPLREGFSGLLFVFRRGSLKKSFEKAEERIMHFTSRWCEYIFESFLCCEEVPMLLQFEAASLNSFCSLNSKPSHRPVLIAYSMQKWRGKTWYILSHEWCQCLQSTRPYLVVSVQSAGVSNVQEAKKVLLLVQTKNACVKCVPSIGEPSHFCQIIAVNKISPGLKERVEQMICHTW